MESAQLRRPKSPKNLTTAMSNQHKSKKLGNSRKGPPDPIDMITLSSGSERGGGGDSSSGEDDGEDATESLDNLSNFQSSGPKPLRMPDRNRFSESKAKRNLAPEKDSDGSLSDGEIREGESPVFPAKTPSRSPTPNLIKMTQKNARDSGKNPGSPVGKDKKKLDVVKTPLSQVEKGQGKKGLSKLAVRVDLVDSSQDLDAEFGNSGFVEDVGPASEDSDEDNNNAGPSKRTPKKKVKSAEKKEQLELVRVTFLNKYLEEKYNSSFRKLVAAIMEKERDNMDKIRAAAEQEKPVTVVYHDCFEEDTSAEKKVDKKTKKGEGVNLYGLTDDVIPDFPVNSRDEEDLSDADSVPSTPKPANFSRQKECFNCGGAHILSECTEPMDRARIMAKRQEFHNSSSPMMNAGRYHESAGESEDRIKPGEFPDCVPGQISDDLMEALGMTRRDLPPWLYRMRACGYPPGHVRNCVVESSGLDFIMEDSDTLDTGPDKIKYDVSKLPKYPGFTVPYTAEVAKNPMVMRHHSQPYPHQSHDTIVSFLSQMAMARETVNPRSPSPEGAVNGDGDDMEMSEDEVMPARANGRRTDDSEEDGVGKVVDEWVKPNSPKIKTSVHAGSLAHSSSLPNGSVSITLEERFELIESPSLPPVTRRDAPLLKTSSVPELGSFSGLGDLPDNDKFAQGVAPWPFEEATASTGRYNAIREALAQTRKRKVDS